MSVAPHAFTPDPGYPADCSACPLPKAHGVHGGVTATPGADVRAVAAFAGANAEKLGLPDLPAQTLAVYRALSDGTWLTLAEVSDRSGAPQASASARIRDLRHIPGLDVQRRSTGSPGIYVYRLVAATQPAHA